MGYFLVVNPSGPAPDLYIAHARMRDATITWTGNTCCMEVLRLSSRLGEGAPGQLSPHTRPWCHIRHVWAEPAVTSNHGSISLGVGHQGKRGRAGLAKP